MDIDETLRDVQRIADHYGYSHQSMKTIEECSELIRAIADDSPDEIIEEMADAQIMIWQMTYLLGCFEKINDEIQYKVDRQIKRIKKEQKK